MKRLRPRMRAAGAPMRQAMAAGQAAPPVPSEVVTALAGWWLLQDVPLPMLVPDRQFLPPESLRLFYVDPLWQRSLLAGAFSVGRSSTDQLSVDAAALVAALPSIVAAASSGAPALLTGCLLNSAVVRGWPTMRIVATDAQGVAVEVVRRQQLADTLLLVLFGGVAQSVIFSEPAEAVHFGLDLPVEKSGAQDGDAPIKPVRAITGPGAGNPLGPPLSKIPMRSADILDVQALAKALQAAVDQAHGNDDAQGKPRPFTPAEFAVEMVRGVQSVTVAVPANPPGVRSHDMQGRDPESAR